MRIVLAVILVVVAGLVTASGCTAFAPPKITVTAQFRDSVGLYVGNDVAVLGIPVGTVKQIRPQGTKVLVTMELDANTRIPANASAVTLSPSVVTDRHVELSPVYRGGAVLRDGDLIPIERTKTPVEIDRVIKAVDQLSSELSTTDNGTGVIQDATSVAAANLAGNGQRLHDTLQALAGAIDAGDRQRDALLSLVRNVDQLTTATARNDGTIRSFSDSLTQATELFAGQAPDFGAALQRLNGLLDQTTKLVNENRASAQATLGKLRTTTQTLAGHTRDLAEATDVLPLLFQNVTRAVDPATGQIRTHADPAEILLDGQMLDGLCQSIGVRLPGCQTGRLGDFGPDLGITELLLGAAK